MYTHGTYSISAVHGGSRIPCKLPMRKIVSPPRLQSSGLHPVALQHCVGRRQNRKHSAFSRIQMKYIGGPKKDRNIRYFQMV